MLCHTVGNQRGLWGWEGLQDEGRGGWWGQRVTASPALSASSPKDPPLGTGMSQRKRFSASSLDMLKDSTVFIADSRPLATTHSRHLGAPHERDAKVAAKGQPGVGSIKNRLHKAEILGFSNKQNESDEIAGKWMKSWAAWIVSCGEKP